MLNKTQQKSILLVSVHWHCILCKILHVMVLMNLSSLGMIVHLSHDTLLQNSTVTFFLFYLWQICHTTKKEHFLLAPNFHFFFSSAQHTYKVKTFLYHGYYNWHTQRALHHTNIITVVNYLTVVLCFLSQYISLVINKICQWLTFALKSFQQRQ